MKEIPEKSNKSEPKSEVNVYNDVSYKAGHILVVKKPRCKDPIR